ncbi:uncharacterized protein [Arachis hypogaea]|uniref:uncharacterized protein isoform X2 n=1 Tax=Arachis hypogaea TaxID=3818 RepID=UPI003B214308
MSSTVLKQSNTRKFLNYKTSNHTLKMHRTLGSLGAEVAGKMKAMWLCPKVSGFDPSERWGHSACFFNGLMYVFGGCCGGMHFSDVLTLDLDKMVWRKVATTGENPGPRDSHSAVIVGHKMIVFGGSNGFKKVNHIHILDLVTKVWVSPECKGTPPSPRESHTAVLVGGYRLVIFGGSGEGRANYLNDLHILELGTMRWTCPELKGEFPVPRDSHSTIAIGNKLIVYGGDSGYQYHGNIDILDMETMTWSKLRIQGSSPGVRAGHAAVNIGTKVYIIGGVGEKRYYNDIWIFDICTCSWTQLYITGQRPQGRFSHTAVVIDMDIVIYGGCGEDENPLNELLVLQHEAEPNPRYNAKTMLMGSNVKEGGAYDFDSGTSQQKRRRVSTTKVWDVDSEQEEHSLSLSQHSSPSQSDQEQTLGQRSNASVTDSQQRLLFKQMNQTPTNCQYNNDLSNKKSMKDITQGNPQNLPSLVHQPKQEQCHLIGAEVRGKIDGAFDSGLLMTASVNGEIFRGVLFAPQAVKVVETNCSLTTQTQPPFVNSNSDHSPQIKRGARSSILFKEHRASKSDLEGLLLTLGGPASANNPEEVDYLGSK